MRRSARHELNSRFAPDVPTTRACRPEPNGFRAAHGTDLIVSFPVFRSICGVDFRRRVSVFRKPPTEEAGGLNISCFHRGKKNTFWESSRRRSRRRRRASPVGL